MSFVVKVTAFAHLLFKYRGETCGVAVTSLTSGFCSQLVTRSRSHLTKSLSKHERSATHIQSQTALKKEKLKYPFGLLASIMLELRKRKILKDLINETCFLAKQELVFRGNDESTSSSNRANYVELLHAFPEKDESLTSTSMLV